MSRPACRHLLCAQISASVSAPAPHPRMSPPFSRRMHTYSHAVCRPLLSLYFSFAKRVFHCIERTFHTSLRSSSLPSALSRLFPSSTLASLPRPAHKPTHPPSHVTRTHSLSLFSPQYSPTRCSPPRSSLDTPPHNTHSHFSHTPSAPLSPHTHSLSLTLTHSLSLSLSSFLDEASLPSRSRLCSRRRRNLNLTSRFRVLLIASCLILKKSSLVLDFEYVILSLVGF